MGDVNRLPGEFECHFSKELPFARVVGRRAGAGLPPTVKERSRNAYELRRRGKVEDCLGSLFDGAVSRNPASVTIFVFMRVEG
jgi:hypothetical protein